MRGHRRDSTVRPRQPRPDDPASRITVQNLSRTYGQVRALDRVSFSVGDGEVFALLGPNGAGKTTIVEILEGYRTRDFGVVEVLGFDPSIAGSAWRPWISLREPDATRTVRMRSFNDAAPPIQEVTMESEGGKMKRRRWNELSRSQRTATMVLAPVELALTAVAVVDLFRRPAWQVRGPKSLWWPAVFVQPVGPVLYLWWGRHR